AVAELHQNGRSAGGSQNQESSLLDATAVPRVHRLQLALNQFGSTRRFTKMLVELEIFQYEIQAHSSFARGGVGLKAYCFVLHLRHPSRVFRPCLRQEVCLEAANVSVAVAPGQRVDVQAHEEITRFGAVAAPVPQSNQG